MNEKEKFINENLGLVHACVRKFISKGIEYDDLFQAGSLGLIKAFNNFDKNRNIKFSTYAVPVILGEIKQLFRNGGAVKVSRSLKDLSLKIARESEKFIFKNNRDPKISELAKILNLEESQITEALSSRVSLVSLGSDVLIKNNSEEEFSEKLALKQVIKNLDMKDKILIISRYFKNYTQDQTARVLNITQVQVSRREKIILKKLKSKLI